MEGSVTETFERDVVHVELWGVQAAVVVSLAEVWPNHPGLLLSDPLSSRMYVLWGLCHAILRRSFGKRDEKTGWSDVPELSSFVCSVWLDGEQHRVKCMLRVPFESFCQLVAGARSICRGDHDGLYVSTMLQFDPFHAFDEHAWLDRLKFIARYARVQEQREWEPERTTVRLQEMKQRIDDYVDQQRTLKSHKHELTDGHGFVKDKSRSGTFERMQDEQDECHRLEILWRIARKQLKADRFTGKVRSRKMKPWRWSCYWPEDLPRINSEEIEAMTKEQSEVILSKFETFATLGCERYDEIGEEELNLYGRPTVMFECSGNACFVPVKSTLEWTSYCLCQPDKHGCPLHFANFEALHYFPCDDMKLVERPFIDTMKDGHVFGINGGGWTTNGPLCHAHYSMTRFASWKQKVLSETRKDVVQFVRRVSK